MKNEKGITLVGLAVTIIILSIIAGIAIGATRGENSNLKVSNKQIQIYNLQQVQQAVLESYLMYIQTNGQSGLVGTKITWDKAKEYTDSINSLASNNSSIALLVAQNNYDMLQDEKCYYELTKTDLLDMGFKNIDLEGMGLELGNVNVPIYVVNYFTGEAFNIALKVTYDNKPLYMSK